MSLPIYLDYASTTPVDPTVAEKMMEFMTPAGHFGNPASRSHMFGWQAVGGASSPSFCLHPPIDSLFMKAEGRASLAEVWLVILCGASGRAPLVELQGEGCEVQ